MANILIITKTIEDSEEDGLYSLNEIGIDDDSLAGDTLLFAILENAFGEREAGVVFGIKDTEGEVVSMLISENNFDEINRQFKLAMQRFFELRVKRTSEQN